MSDLRNIARHLVVIQFWIANPNEAIIDKQYLESKTLALTSTACLIPVDQSHIRLNWLFPRICFKHDLKFMNSWKTLWIPPTLRWKYGYFHIGVFKFRLEKNRWQLHFPRKHPSTSPRRTRRNPVSKRRHLAMMLRLVSVSQPQRCSMTLTGTQPCPFTSWWKQHRGKGWKLERNAKIYLKHHS